MKEVTVVKYISDDGRQFDTKALCEKYEATIRVSDALKQFAIDGPSTAYGEPSTLMSPDYKWYRAENEEEMNTILEALNSVTHFRGPIPEFCYPEYVGYSANFHKTIFLRNIIIQRDMEAKAYREFISNFPDVILDSPDAIF